MVTRPVVHPPRTTIGELRDYFEDDHVHVALIVHAGKLLGAVERGDLAPELDDRSPALEAAVLDGRTIAPDLPTAGALTAMRLGGRRRLAVTSADGELLGLLCLKTSGQGFCSDDDVAARRVTTS